MNTQLLIDLTTRASAVSVHFCETDEFDGITRELAARDVAVFSIEGGSISSRDDLYRAFALALKKPKGWYGDEEYAPNADAFLEYLDDVHEWVPAKGHVVVVRDAQHLGREQPRLAGLLVELWQFANGRRDANIHLVFGW